MSRPEKCFLVIHVSGGRAGFTVNGNRKVGATTRSCSDGTKWAGAAAPYDLAILKKGTHPAIKQNHDTRFRAIGLAISLI
jgi:hypothetical protein